MDPCPFVRLLVGNLALKIPVAAKPSSSVVHPSTSPCFCKIHLLHSPLQTVVVPLVLPNTAFPDPLSSTSAASFHLNSADLQMLARKSIFGGKPCLRISIYTRRSRGEGCYLPLQFGFGFA